MSLGLQPIAPPLNMSLEMPSTANPTGNPPAVVQTALAPHPKLSPTSLSFSTSVPGGISSTPSPRVIHAPGSPASPNSTSQLTIVVENQSTSTYQSPVTTAQQSPVTTTTTNPVGTGASENSVNIFVAGLTQSITDKGFEDLFSSFGKIRSAKVMLDVNTGTSRGYGFLLFENEADGRRAMAEMDGTALGPNTLHISVSEHDGHVVKCKTIYVRNLPLSISEREVVAKFATCGPIVRCTLKRDNSGNFNTHTKYNLASIEYKTTDDAQSAVRLAHGNKPFEGCTIPLLAKFAESVESRESRRLKRFQRGPAALQLPPPPAYCPPPVTTLQPNGLAQFTAPPPPPPPAQAPLTNPMSFSLPAPATVQHGTPIQGSVTPMQTGTGLGHSFSGIPQAGQPQPQSQPQPQQQVVLVHAGGSVPTSQTASPNQSFTVFPQTGHSTPPQTSTPHIVSPPQGAVNMPGAAGSPQQPTYVVVQQPPQPPSDCATSQAASNLTGFPGLSQTLSRQSSGNSLMSSLQASQPSSVNLVAAPQPGQVQQQNNGGLGTSWPPPYVQTQTTQGGLLAAVAAPVQPQPGQLPRTGSGYGSFTLYPQQK